MTIDGPAGSGKSTTARLVAKKLGWIYLDTGAMYRAVTLKVLRDQIALDDAESIGRIAEKIKIQLVPAEKGTQVFLDGSEVTSEIRHPEVDRAVGPVCEVQKVRQVMVDLQRKMSRKGHVVAEGRDMGTIVFPNADVKFFMTASVNARAQRRYHDHKKQGIDISADELKIEMRRRDQRDSQRQNSPLVMAKDAILLDTTQMNIQEQVDFIIRNIQRHIAL